MFCKNCGANLDDNALSCPGCGLSAINETYPVKPVNPVINQNVYINPAVKDNKGFAIASFVLSLSSIFLYICCFALFGTISPILAVIFGIIGLKSSLKGLAIAGIIIGALTIIGTIIFVTFLGISVLSDPDFYNQFQNAYDQYQYQY